jgi:hypothetical protein
LQKCMLTKCCLYAVVKLWNWISALAKLSTT